MTKEEFLIHLDSYFRIENVGSFLYSPTKKHHFSMYLDGEYYKLYLRKDTFEINNPLDDLDAYILFKTVLEPVLQIKDLSHDKQVTYLPEAHGIHQLKTEADKGRFELGFGLYPVTVEQLKAVADAQLAMPPKSTYIQPKLRSGLTIYELR